MCESKIKTYNLEGTNSLGSDKSELQLNLEAQKLHKLSQKYFSVPPDFELAKKYREANKVRYMTSTLDKYKYTCCCCNNMDLKQSRRLGLCEPPDMLIQYGDGFPLLFQFLRFVVLLI